MGVVEYDNDEIVRLFDADGGKAAKAHEHVAIAGQHGDAPIRSRQSKAKADHGGAAHGAPEIKVQRMIAGRGDVVSCRTEPGNDQEIAAIDQELPHKIAPINHLATFASPRPYFGADQPLR